MLPLLRLFDMWSVNKIRSSGGMTMSREKISTQRNPVSLVLCPQQIRHGMTWEIKKNLSHSLFCFQNSLFLKIILIKMISTMLSTMK